MLVEPTETSLEGQDDSEVPVCVGADMVKWMQWLYAILLSLPSPRTHDQRTGKVEGTKG